MGTKKASPPATVAGIETEAVRPHVEERGEIALTLDGEDLVMRPSYEAIAGFEMTTGKGLLQLTEAALKRQMSLAETAQIVAECVRAWGRAANSTSAKGVNAPRIAELIMESEVGFHGALNTVAGMLALAATGGYTAQGELKPTTKMTTTALAPVVG